MFRRNTNLLATEIQQAKKELKHTTDLETEVVLGNYLCQLQIIMSEFDHKKFDSIFKMLGNEKSYRHYNSCYKVYRDEMLDAFIDSKEFHHDYLGDIYYGILLPFSKIKPPIITEPTELSKIDFLDLFFQFLQSVHLDGEFEKMIKDGRIFLNNNVNNPFLGWTIQNPITGKSFIFLNQEERTLDSMSTLVHEFGHAYHMEHAVKDSHSHRVNTYQSFYGEVPSRCFERLFIDYLWKYGLFPEETKDLFYNYLSFQLEYLFGAYLESKFPDDIIYNSFYQKMSRKQLYENMKDDFIFAPHLYDYFLNHPHFDIQGDYKYAYGDILSLFLAKSIEEEGLSSPELKRFLEHSCELFDENFILENGYSADKYLEEHQKQLTIFKK